MRWWVTAVASHLLGTRAARDDPKADRLNPARLGRGAIRAAAACLQRHGLCLPRLCMARRVYVVRCTARLAYERACAHCAIGAVRGRVIVLARACACCTL
jgi:hypothetical protein